MKRSPLYLLLLVYVFIAACSAEPITMEDNESTVQFAINTPFEIELSANPSTGNKWQIVAYDTNIIRHIGGPEYKNESDKAGSAGTVTYEFETKSAGNTTLWMVYKGKDQPQAEEMKTFRLNIISGTVGRITAD